jgi:hypothetical protein
MALLLLQDCLIDLSNINNSMSITLNENLVNKIVNNGCFDEDDTSKLLENIKNFINEHNYQTNTLYVSSVFFNIPFFEEKLRESTNLELNSIYDYVRNIDIQKVEFLEIGKYFFCRTIFDYEKNKLKSFNIEGFNIDNEISDFISIDENCSFTDIKTIKKINQELDTDTYADITDLEYIQLKSIFKEIQSDINVKAYYEKIINYFEKTANNETLIVNQLSILYLFEYKNIIEFKENKTVKSIKKSKNNFIVEVLPSVLSFQNEIVFNFWTDNDKSNIIIKNNDMTGELKIESKEKDNNIINLSELNFDNIILKADSLNNLSCKITDLKNNSTVTTKINFN